jgi:hypothetical protein
MYEMNQNLTNTKYKFVKQNASNTLNVPVVSNIAVQQNGFKLINPNVPKQPPASSFINPKSSAHVANPALYRFEPVRTKTDQHRKAALVVALPQNFTQNNSTINSIMKSSSKLDDLLQQCREIGCSKSSPVSSASPSSTSSSTVSSVVAKLAVKPQPKLLTTSNPFNNPYKTVNIGKLSILNLPTENRSKLFQSN